MTRLHHFGIAADKLVRAFEFEDVTHVTSPVDGVHDGAVVDEDVIELPLARATRVGAWNKPSNLT